MSLNPKLQLATKQTAALRMNGQIRQSLEMLQLSSYDLTAFVQEAATENPLLEIEALPDFTGRRPSRNVKSGQGTDDLASRGGDNETLESMLLGQIGLLSLAPAIRKAAEFLAGCVDEAGYVAVSIQEASARLKLPAGDIEEALAVLQSLDPPGVGARSLSECLALQIRRSGSPLPFAEAIIRDHLEDLGRGRFDKIAKWFDAEEDDVKKVYHALHELHPRPGMAFGSGDNRYVIPDAVVRADSGGFTIRLNDAVTPALSVNHDYCKMVKGSDNREAQAYLQEKLKSARWIVRGLEQRKATLFKVIQAVMAEQGTFLKDGAQAIAPLTMKKLSDKLDVHESTISRAVQNKYIGTPHGTFELKAFFCPGIRRKDGEVESNRKIKARIAVLVRNENKSRPYSDQKIAELLASDGIQISRRTVTKYREGLNILPSPLRKRRS